MKTEGGFTLLELIITLIVASIMAAMYVQFIGATTVGSVNSVLYIQQQSYLNMIMENINADYKMLLSTSATPLETLVERVGAENTSQTYYSNPQQPYRVVTNRRISFTSSNPATEQSDANGRLQKITVRYPDTATGFTLTILLSK